MAFVLILLFLYSFLRVTPWLRVSVVDVVLVAAQLLCIHLRNLRLNGFSFAFAVACCLWPLDGKHPAAAQEGKVINPYLCRGLCTGISRHLCQ